MDEKLLHETIVDDSTVHILCYLQVTKSLHKRNHTQPILLSQVQQLFDLRLTATTTNCMTSQKYIIQ